MLGGEHRSVHARTDVELAQKVLHMDIDGGLGNAVLAGNLLVAGAVRDASQDVKFAR